MFNTTVAVIGKPTPQKLKQSITFLISFWILVCRVLYMLYYREEHCIKMGSILIYKLHIFCKASNKKYENNIYKILISLGNCSW